MAVRRAGPLELADDLKARGLGTSTGLLLVGPPGTGKTVLGTNDAVTTAALLAEAKVGRWRAERQAAGQYL